MAPPVSRGHLRFHAHPTWFSSIYTFASGEAIMGWTTSQWLHPGRRHTVPRQKPRYPLQLDNAFVELCQAYQVETFSMECLLVATAVLSPLGDGSSEFYVEPVSKMLQKLAIKYPNLPSFTLAVQGRLD